MLVISILLSIVGLYLAWKVHQRYEPARYFLLFWGLQIVIGLSLLVGKFDFNGKGLTYIATMCILFSMGSLLGGRLSRRVEAKVHQHRFWERLALGMLFIGLLMALLHWVEGLWTNGYALADLFSGQALLRLNDAASDTRYLAPPPVSILSRITLVFLYLTPLYGGYLLPLLKGKKRGWTYLPLLPPLFMALTLSVKSALITSVALWCIGILVSALANNRDFLKVRKATVFKWMGGGLVLILVLFTSMVLRTGKFDQHSVRETEQKIVIYACGHLPAFDAWFEQKAGTVKPSWGVKTFYGLSAPLGLAKREQGVFTEYVVLGDKKGPQVPHLMDTNVYTLFRFLIEDFGLLGSSLFLLLAGMLAGFASAFVRKRPGNAFFQVVLMAILFTIAWSFVGSVWAYTSYMATMVLMWGLVKVSFYGYNPKKV